MPHPLISVIKSQMEGAPASEVEVASVLPLAKKHDLAQFVYAAVHDQKNLARIVARMMWVDAATQQAMEILGQAQIAHIPLKGAVLRGMYPEMWMRTCSDVDVLVHEDDLDRAVEALGRGGFQVKREKDFHDITLVAESGVCLELHFNLREGIVPMDRVLDRVWDYAAPAGDPPFRYQESPEFFLFHHMAHMAYHFKEGGCGVRPFLDLWLLEQKLDVDRTVYRQLLREAELEKFEENACKLARHWFGDAPEVQPDPLLLHMETYVLNGVADRARTQCMVIHQERAGGKARYFAQRIFLPYETMTILYPVLHKHKWLTPILEVHRWGKALLGARQKTMREVKLAMGSKPDYSIEMMHSLGL
jgi:hypothetical protein